MSRLRLPGGRRRCLRTPGPLRPLTNVETIPSPTAEQFTQSPCVDHAAPSSWSEPASSTARRAATETTPGSAAGYTRSVVAVVAGGGDDRGWVVARQDLLHRRLQERAGTGVVHRLHAEGEADDVHLVLGGPEHGAGHRLLTGEAVALESAVRDDPRLRIDLANDASGERAVPSTEVEKLVVRQGVQLVDDIVGVAALLWRATSLSQPSPRSSSAIPVSITATTISPSADVGTAPSGGKSATVTEVGAGPSTDFTTMCRAVSIVGETSIPWSLREASASSTASRASSSVPDWNSYTETRSCSAWQRGSSAESGASHKARSVSPRTASSLSIAVGEENLARDHERLAVPKPVDDFERERTPLDAPLPQHCPGPARPLGRAAVGRSPAAGLGSAFVPGLGRSDPDRASELAWNCLPRDRTAIRAAAGSCLLLMRLGRQLIRLARSPGLDRCGLTARRSSPSGPSVVFPTSWRRDLPCPARPTC